MWPRALGFLANRHSAVDSSGIEFQKGCGGGRVGSNRPSRVERGGIHFRLIYEE